MRWTQFDAGIIQRDMTRVAQFLAEQSEPDRPSNHRRWTQEEMAAEVGTVREMTGQALRHLAQDGLIRLERHRIHIVDREGLRALS
jgi:CRP-like cAMP-binding protein